MPSLISFVTKAWKALGAFKIGGVAVLQQAVVSFAIGQVLQKLGEQKVEPTKLEGSIKLNNTSNVSPIPVIYGERIVGGSEYRAVSGGDNKYLYRVVVLSEGQINSITNVYLNDIDINDDRYNGFVSVDYKLGTTTQTASSVMQETLGWDSTFKGAGIAYIVVKLTYDRDVFASGLPTITAKVQGKRVYDPRLDDGGTQLVANGYIIADTAPLVGASTYTNLKTNADGHPDVNSGNLRIWHRQEPNDAGTYTPTTLGTPFERLGTPTSFTSTSDSFDVVNNSGSEIRIGMLTSRTVLASEADNTLMTISGTVNSLTTTGANQIVIAPTNGTTGGGSWTPDGGNAYITSTGDFSLTIDLADNPTQYNLQGINFFVGDGEAINVSNIKFSLHDKDVDTKTSSYSYDAKTDTLRMEVARTGGVGGYSSYFRIGALKEGVYYRVTGKARVVSNTTGGTAKAFWDLSDGNDTGEFKTETTSTTFVDIDDSGYFSINGTYNASAGTHSFLDINITVTGNTVTTGGIVVEYQNLRIEELTSATLNANSNQSVVNATQSVNNSATWTWSENPALCILDYLTNTVYGRGIPYSDIDLNSFMVEADYCDENVTLKDSSGNDIPNQKRYTCNGFVNPEKTSFDIINELLSSCRGALVSPNEKFKLVIDKPTNSVFTFDETNIIGAWNISGAGVRQRKNKIVSRFFDTNNNYDEGILITTSTGSTNFYADDNYRTLQADLSFPFTNEITRVDILAQHFLKQSRLNWKVSFTATMDCLKVEAMDLIGIKHPVVGWDGFTNGKLFRVNTVELLSEDTVKITAEEYDTSVYTFDVNTPPASPTTNLPDPQSALPPSNLALDSSELLVNKDGTVIERIKATWNAPNFGYVSHYEIAYKTQGDAGFSIISTDDTTFYISPVNSTNDINTGIYFVKVRAVYPSNKRSAWYPSNDGQEHEVAGKSALPNKPLNFAVSILSNYTRKFEWTNPSDPDIAGFKIRYSETLSHLWDNMIELHTGLLVTSPWETDLLSEGTYRFAIKSVDTSGNFSQDALYITGILTDNPRVDILNAYYPRLLGFESVGKIGDTDGYKNIYTTVTISSTNYNITLKYKRRELEEGYWVNAPIYATDHQFAFYESDVFTHPTYGEGRWMLARYTPQTGGYIWFMGFQGVANYQPVWQGGVWQVTSTSPSNYHIPPLGTYTNLNDSTTVTLSITNDVDAQMVNDSPATSVIGGVTYYNKKLDIPANTHWEIYLNAGTTPIDSGITEDAITLKRSYTAQGTYTVKGNNDNFLSFPDQVGGIVDPLSLDLDSFGGDNAQWDDLGTTTWDNWNEWGFASETIVYETNGFEFGTELTFRPVIQSTSVGTISHQIATVPDTVTRGEGYSSSDYGSFFTPTGVITAKAIKTKTTVTGVNATLSSLSILLDGLQLEEQLLNLDTSTIGSAYIISAGDIYLPLQKNYTKISTIQVTFINAGGLKSYEIIDKTTTVNNKLAPRIKLHHSSSVAHATIDVVVKGY